MRETEIVLKKFCPNNWLNFKNWRSRRPPSRPLLAGFPVSNQTVRPIQPRPLTSKSHPNSPDHQLQLLSSSKPLLFNSLNLVRVRYCGHRWNRRSRTFPPFDPVTYTCFPSSAHSAAESKRKAAKSASARCLLSPSLQPTAHGHCQITDSQVSQAKSQVPNLDRLLLTLDLLSRRVHTVPCGCSILRLATSRKATFPPVFFYILRCTDFGCLLQPHWHIFDFPFCPITPWYMSLNRPKPDKSSQPFIVFLVLNPCTLFWAPDPVRWWCGFTSLVGTSPIHYFQLNHSTWLRVANAPPWPITVIFLLIPHPKELVSEHPAAMDSPAKLSPQPLGA